MRADAKILPVVLLVVAGVFVTTTSYDETRSFWSNVTSSDIASCGQPYDEPRMKGLVRDSADDAEKSPQPLQGVNIRVFNYSYIHGDNSTAEAFKDVRVRGPFWAYELTRPEVERGYLDRSWTEEDGCFAVRLPEGPASVCIGDERMVCFPTNESDSNVSVVGEPLESLKSDGWRISERYEEVIKVGVFRNQRAVPRPEPRASEDDSNADNDTEPDVAWEDRDWREVQVRVNVTGHPGTNTLDVRVDEDARRGWDGYEASRLAPPGRDAYVQLVSPIRHDGGVRLRVLASVPPPSENARVDVPVGVVSEGVTGEARISVVDNAGLPSFNVSLFDSRSGEHVGVGGAHTFTVDEGSPDGVGTRFRLRLQAPSE